MPGHGASPFVLRTFPPRAGETGCWVLTRESGHNALGLISVAIAGVGTFEDGALGVGDAFVVVGVEVVGGP